MKKAVFQRFILIVILALVLSGSISAVAFSKIILEQSQEKMFYSVRIADYGIEYQEDLKQQVDKLKEVEGNEHTRFTVITTAGTVIADSEVANSSVMENHGDREEVIGALKKGTGYAIRRSDTLNKSMLYVACLSNNKQYILRMAVPFTGLEQYIRLVIPGFLVSVGITLGLSIILAKRFSV